jgi:hypothetical protein
MPAPVGTGRALGVLTSNPDPLDGLSFTEGSMIGFFGVAKVVQPANAAQAALTVITATVCGFGFPNATAFNSFTAQLENIRASLVTLGLLKGGA